MDTRFLESFVAVASENPSCVMLKHEDWPGLEKITTLRGFERDGSMRHIPVLAGLVPRCETGSQSLVVW